MNVEIGAEAAQFPEKEYINGIAVAVYLTQQLSCVSHSNLNKSHLESLCKLWLELQRITAQQTQVHLRLS
jgi:hypothetical protein